MKSIKYSLIAALALSGALSACDDDVEYVPADTPDGAQVYFSLDEADEIDITENATSIAVNLNRYNGDEALTVNLTSTVTDASGADASSIFTVPSQVSFNAGEKVTAINVGVAFSSVEPDETYTLTINVEGDVTTPFGASSRTFTMSYAPWTEWELYSSTEYGIYTMTTYTSGEFELPVYYRSSVVNPDNMQFTVTNLFTSGSDFVYSIDMSKTVEVDGEQYPMVALETYVSGLENNSGSGEYFIWADVRTWCMEVLGYPEDQVDAVMAANDFGQSYYNPETGLLSINVLLYSTKLSAGYMYANDYEYLQLPGFANYDVMLNYTGNFVDPDGEEYAIVSAVKTDDVSSYIYDIFSGALTEDEVSAAAETMMADDTLEKITESSTSLSFQLTEAGDYTVVAVGYDSSNNAVCTVSYTFSYSTVKADDPWETIGYCEYTDAFVCSAFTLGGETWDVEVQQSTETAGLYRLVDPYATWPGLQSQSWVLSGKQYIVINAENPNRVYIEYSPMGLNVGGYGDMAAYSVAANLLEQGYSADLVATANVFGTMEDGIITFPTGSLLVEVGEGEGFYYANIDPDNPGLSDDTIEFDRTWGTGTFYVDMGGLTTAASVKPKASSVSAPTTGSLKLRGVLSDVKSQAKAKKTVDASTVREYRLSHPSSIK